MTSDRPTVGKRIRKMRESMHLTQGDITRLTHIPIETLSRLENGYRYPSATALVLLCRTFDVSACELLGT